jgi:hypothetical protein
MIGDDRWPDGSPMYYDRAGNPITMGRWMDLHCDRAYLVVAKTQVGGMWEVSTVWLGLDHQYLDGPPLIFETMVFDLAESNSTGGYPYHEAVMDGVQLRYPTETSARAGHWATVAEARDLFLPGALVS